jgi:hypothetical protein
MSYRRILLLIAAVLLFGIHSVLAANFAVGTCEPKLVSFSTISDAVSSSSVPAGSTVEVCPGTYPEQVTISKALTLEGITSGNSNQAIITVPVAGLVLDASGFAVQIEVTAGPVNITNITVDGTGNDLGGSALLIGIFYGSGSSGVIKDVTTRNQLNSGQGTGILADNTNGTIESVTIEDCSVHDFDDIGIGVEGNFTATVKANHVNGSSAPRIGIAVMSAGSVTDNEVTGPGISVGFGIDVDFPGVTISDNTVTNWNTGLIDSDAAKYTSNTVGNTERGFFLALAGSTVESNTITQANVGIDFDCRTVAVKSNTINDAATGIDNVPSGLSSANAYFNVSEIRNSCSGTDLPKRMAPARRPTSE